MPDKLLAITGGAGNVATAIRPLLREHFRIRLVDVRDTPANLDGDEYLQLDVASLEAAERTAAGADAVLHLAANPSTSAPAAVRSAASRSEEDTYELQSHSEIVCRLLLE